MRVVQPFALSPSEDEGEQVLQKVILSCKAFPYCDNNVTSFWSTSEIVSVGKVQTNSAFLARQSKLLTWSDNIAPATGSPAGIRTSNG